MRIIFCLLVENKNWKNTLCDIWHRKYLHKLHLYANSLFEIITFNFLYARFSIIPSGFRSFDFISRKCVSIATVTTSIGDRIGVPHIFPLRGAALIPPAAIKHISQILCHLSHRRLNTDWSFTRTCFAASLNRTIVGSDGIFYFTERSGLSYTAGARQPWRG